MNISMMRLIFMVVILQVLMTNAFSQATAVKWQRYELWEEGLSASFPKLPMILDSSDICRHQAKKTYYAYTEGAVYHISVVRELKGDDSFCSDTKKFNAKAFDERKKELSKNAESADISINGKTIPRFIGSVATTLFFDDLKNNRWLEVAVSSHDSEKRDSIDLASSVQTGSKGGGAYIGQGAKTMIGDTLPKDLPTLSEDEVKASNLDARLVVVGRPRPAYTNAARSHNEQGTVRLKIEFRADGTIGNIEIQKSLKYGLTEQAVAAAKRFAFVPARSKKMPVTLFKIVEFSFAIY